MKLKTQILSTACAFPRQVVLSSELDKRYGQPEGTFESKSGVKSRHYASNEETTSKLGAESARKAFEKAGLKIGDVDLILNASGIPEQTLPCTAAFIQKELGLEKSGIPCFDVNATCLSYVAAYNTAAALIHAGQVRRVLIVSSEICSIGINYENLEAASLFGDGAVATILQASSETENTAVLGFHMETYSEFADCCEVEGFGSKLHPRRMGWDIQKDDPRFLFKMDGPKVFKISAKAIPDFLGKLFEKSNTSMDEIKLVIPHQASSSALKLMQRRLDLPDERFFKFNETYGNMVAASLPLGLHLALERKLVAKGDKVMLVGTSAGLSIGGIIIQL